MSRNHRCRQKNCPNTYSDVIGGEMAFGKHYSGAECLPCFYAALIIEYGLTIEQIEQSENFMGMMQPHLEKTGWSWNDVRDSYQRGALLM